MEIIDVDLQGGGTARGMSLSESEVFTDELKKALRSVICVKLAQDFEKGVRPDEMFNVDNPTNESMTKLSKFVVSALAYETIEIIKDLQTMSQEDFKKAMCDACGMKLQ